MTRRQEPRLREESEAHRWQAPYGRRIPDHKEHHRHEMKGADDAE